MGVDEAKLTAMHFDEELEDQLKRLDPVEYACAGSEKARLALAGKVYPGHWRPHHLMHSIEASCAYHRRYKREEVTEKRLRQIMNLYNEYPEPYSHHLLANEQKLDLAMRVMHEQQMPLQRRVIRNDIARAQCLLVRNDPIPQTNEWLQQHHQLTAFEWLALAFGAAVGTRGDGMPIVTAESLEQFEGWDIARGSIDSFLRFSSRTVAEVGTQYRRDRQELEKPYLRELIRCGFLAWPLLDLQDGTYLAPLPELLMLHAFEGLYRICGDCSAFGKELGDSFESYVGQVLDEIPGGTTHGLEELKKVLPQEGQRCDYVVETPDILILIECKAVTVTARILTESVLRANNSTTKIAQGIGQLVATGQSIRASVLDTVISDRKKP